MIILIFIVFALGCGWLITNLLDDMELPLALSVSLLLGMALIAWQLMVYSLLRWSWGWIGIIAPWLMLVVVLRKYLKFPSWKRVHQQKQPPMRVVYLVLAGLMMIMILSLYAYRFYQSLDLLAWDGMEIWFFKAKAFYVDKGISETFLTHPNAKSLEITDTYFKSSYPPLLPLMISTVYFTIEKASIAWGKLIWVFMFTTVVTIYFSEVRRQTNALMGLVFTFFMLSVPAMLSHMSHTFAGYADLPTAAYILAATVMWMRYESNKNLKYMMLALTLAAMASLIKDDALVFLLALILVSKQWKLIPIPALLLLPWILMKWKMGLNSYLLSNELSMHWSYIEPTVRYFFQTSANVKLFYLAWPLMLISIIIGIIRKNSQILRLAALIGLCIVGYMAVFFITPLDINRHLISSVDRLLIQIYPTAMLIPPLVIGRYVKGKK